MSTGPGRCHPIIGVLAVLLLSGLLQACSVMKIAYNQATDLAYWQLHAYFNFTEAQSPLVREELARVHQWHRRTELPAYVQTLQNWQARLPGDVDETQACRLFDEVRSRLHALSVHAVPALGTVIGTLGASQLEDLKRKFAKLNAEYRSDFVDGPPDQRIDKRLKKAVRRAEMLYGALTDQQLALLRRRIAQSVFDAGVSLGESQRRQRDALQSLAPLIGGRSSPEQARPVLLAYVERSVNSPDPVYRSYQDQLARDSCSTFAALHNSTSPAQRAKAVQTLAGYEKDLWILAAQR